MQAASWRLTSFKQKGDGMQGITQCISYAGERNVPNLRHGIIAGYRNFRSMSLGLDGGGGGAVTQLVEALRHKTGGPGFESRWGSWKSSNDVTLVSEFDSPGVEMSTKERCWG